MKAGRHYEHLREDEKEAVLKAREHFAKTGLPPVRESGSVMDEITTVFRNCEVWQFSPGDDSVQRAILDATPKRHLFQSVSEGVRGLLFDLVFEMVCGPGVSRKEDTLEAAKSLSRLIVDPDTLIWDENVQRYMAEKIGSEGKLFLKALGDAFYNAGRRFTRLPVDRATLVMTRHWVNPHCPLWMMTNRVLMEVLPRLADGVSWTPETIRKRLKKLKEAGACRFPGQPIFDVKLRPIPESKPDAGKTGVYKSKRQNAFQTLSEVQTDPNATAFPSGEPDEPYYHPASGAVIERFSVFGKNPLQPMKIFGYWIEFASRRRCSG